MKRKITLFKLLAVIFLITGVNLVQLYAQEYKEGVLQGTFRVKLRPSIGEAVNLTVAADGKTVKTGIQAFDNLNSKYTVSNMKRVFAYSPKYEYKLKEHGLDLWYEVSYEGTFDTKGIIKEYGNLDIIEISEPIYEKALIEPGSPRIIETSSVRSAEALPFNDPYLLKQWQYNNVGQSGGTPGADINLFKAWETETGSSDVIVSIHDQGVDFKHEDLSANMWINEAELNGLPNVDDDNNGYKDDVYGFNFADNMGMINPGYHGTHVAGTIGAVNNNGLGVAGVAGGNGTESGVRLMSCQILGGVSQGNTPDSYVYAANNGAIISQNSWGYISKDSYEQAVLDAIDYFIAEAGDYEGSPMKGGAVLFAAGNNNLDGNWWPGCYKNVIAVSALSAKNIKSTYSNFGKWVDIGAPGGEYTDDNNMTEKQQEEGYSNSILSTFNNNAYGYLDGTSMACPHVSGIAALVVSKYGGENFTAADLKTHILTGISNIDTIAGNEGYAGKLGTGAADALAALAGENKLAPLAVNDLSITAISQDFAVLEWSVTTDPDDGKPFYFEVLHSREPITAGTMEFARSKIIRNDLAAGEKLYYEIGGLEALTNYYFSVRAIDRWNNISEFSNAITGTTNEGPDAWIDESDFSVKLVYVGYDPAVGSIYDTILYKPVDINVQTANEGSTDFYLHNTGVGLLRWDLEPRHVESIDAYSIKYVNDPEITSPYTGHNIKIMSLVAPRLPVQTYSQEANDDFMEYINNWGSFYYIGETDTSFTNSAATHFVVDNPEGFNMTHAEIFLNYASSRTAPAIFEIYLGEDINSARLTYVQELTGTKAGWNYFNLEEQIFMEEGTHFWMVIHIPSGNLFPLGAALELKPDDSKNCYMSLNMGKSWQLFEDLYYNNLLAWAMTAVSKYKTPGEIITLSPVAGEVTTNDSVMVTASVDGSKMINGTYKTSVVFNTNETEETMLRANVWTTVQGQKPVIKGTSIVDFGGVIYGNEKMIDITLKNEGYGKFNSPTITISDPQFKLVGYLSTINPRSEYTFQMIFRPSGTGNANAKITISNSKGDSYIFYASGAGLEPPVMKLSPDSSSFMDLSVGDTVTGEFYLRNTGNYPLNYYFPAFAQGENVGEVSGDFCKYGYSAKLNQDGVFTAPAFEWTEISGTGSEITDYSTEREFWFYEIELGFDFPFFGKRENSVFITNYGLVSFDQNSVFNRVPLFFKDKYNPDRLISALGYRHSLSIGGHVYYQDLGDRFVIQYEKVNYFTFDPITWQEVMKYLTYQIVLHSNGNINIYYKDMDGVDPYTLNWDTYVGIEDQNASDGLLIAQQNVTNLLLTNNTAVEIINPGLGLIYEMTNPEGTVQAGDSVKITYAARTDILNVADHLEKVPVLTNDPFNNPGIYTMFFNVTGGGSPELHLSDTVFDYGKVFQTDSAAFNLWITNSGKANDTLTSATFKNGYFTVNGSFPLVTSPNRKILYTVTAGTDFLGTYKDTLTFTTATGEKLSIALLAEIIEAPQMASNITSLNDTLVSGDVLTKKLTITNGGGNDLDFAPVGNDWITVSEPMTKSVNIPGFTYNWTKSTNENGPGYEWIDVVGSGIHLDSLDAWPGYSGGNYTFWSKGIRLPFTFNFFGNDYDTIYIGFNGVITFTKDDNFYPFGGINIPNSDEPNNFIAPLWAFTYMDNMVYEDAGVYYKIFDDRIVVEWNRFTDGFYMGYGISWEAILYADGNIKFQYNFGENNEEFLSSNGVIGLENEDGTEGTLVAYHTFGFIDDKLAISLVPVRKYTIAAGTSMDFDLIVNASYLYAGDYSYNLPLLNNAPHAGKYRIPVQLHVTGEAGMVAPDSINFGEVMVYQTKNEWGSIVPMSYSEEFEIVNDGTARMEVFAFDVAKLTGTRVEAYVLAADWFGNMTWQWYDVMSLPIFDWGCSCSLPIYIEPNSSMKFKATITPSNADPVRDTLIISTDYASGTDRRITFMADPMLPPAASVADNEIYVYAETKSHTETRTFYLSNIEGSSDLEFEIELVYSRKIDKAQATATIEAVSAPILESMTPGIEPMTTKSVSEDFNRILEHDSATSPETLLGYGGNAMFITGTRFTAPSDGFNLTHIRTWYVPGDWLFSRIVVQILCGSSDLASATVIHTQEFDHYIDKNDPVGEYITFELDQNHIFYPNEDFFVVFKYPTGAKFPQGSVKSTDQVYGRFMYGNGESWYDITESSYSDYGWMVKALESEYGSAKWVELTSESNGTISAGDSAGMNLNFTAGFAERGINEAKAIITSNDPYKSKIEIPVYLYRNEGPRFNLGSEISLEVCENDTLNLEIRAIDLEEDPFTLSLAENYELVSAVYSEDILSFTYSPDFESAGMHNFIVEGNDTYGNSNEFMININVTDVNRAPEAIQVGTLELYENGDNYFMTAEELFSDADGDNIEVTSASTNDESVAAVFKSGSKFVIIPGQTGTADITFSAEDVRGALSINTIVVTVVPSTGIDNNPTGKFMVYPNPTADDVYISFPEDTEGVITISLVNLTGQIIEQVKLADHANNTYRFDMRDHPEGVYFINISNQDIITSELIIKK